MMMRAAFWIFSGKLGNQLVTLGVVMILARLLIPEDFGTVAASQVILTLSQVVARFGIGTYLIQAEKLTPRIIGTAMTLMLSVALCISAILWTLASQIGDAINVPELAQIMPILLASLILYAAINPSTSLLSREMEFKFIAKTEVTSHAIGFGAVAITLAILGFGYWAIILGSFAKTLMRGVLVFWRMPVWPSFSMKLSEISPMLRFGSGVFLAQIMSNVARRVDNLIITSTMGPASLGYYSRAYGLMEISNKLLGSVFLETLFSGFSKKRREGQKIDRNNAFLISHAFAAFLIIPISALMWLLADEIVWILLGANWVDAVPVLEVLSLGIFFRLGYKVSDAFNLSEGAVICAALLNCLYALMVAAGAWIGSRWGITGVAWGVLGALAIHFTLTTTAALLLSGSNWGTYIKTVLPFFIVASLVGVIVYGARTALWTELAFADMTAAISFVTMYGVILYMARRQQVIQLVLLQIAKLGLYLSKQWHHRPATRG